MSQTEYLALDAAELYELGKDDELFQLAERLTSASDKSTPTAAHAEVFRLARVVSVRKGDRVAAELWGARAWTAAMLSGASNVAAALLCPIFLFSWSLRHSRNPGPY